jgi:hypothetical protein
MLFSTNNMIRLKTLIYTQKNHCTLYSEMGKSIDLLIGTDESIDSSVSMYRYFESIPLAPIYCLYLFFQPDLLHTIFLFTKITIFYFLSIELKDFFCQNGVFRPSFFSAVQTAPLKLGMQCSSIL